MVEPPIISVVVPAHDAGEWLPRTIASLIASDLPRAAWELIVVDDASSDDGIANSLEGVDSVITLAGPPRGPASARNRGADAAQAPIVAFVDSDVRVHPDALRRIVEHFRADPELGAVFGSYDAGPSDPGFVSQYRNLLHHYVHQRKGGDVESFWAGCGAVRRSAFVKAGKFDELRYPVPQIEDIELGYRMRDAGYRLVLDPAIQGTHMKGWTLPRMVRSDFKHRGVPYARLLLARGTLLTTRGLSAGSAEKASAALVALALVAIAGAAVFRDWRWLTGLVICFAAFAFVNWTMLSWYASRRGIWFALRAAAIHVIYHATSLAALAYATFTHLIDSATHGRAPHAPS